MELFIALLIGVPVILVGLYTIVYMWTHDIGPGSD